MVNISDIWWHESSWHRGAAGSLIKMIKNHTFYWCLQCCSLSCLSFSPDSVHRGPGHLWIWGLWKQQLWTVLHQLCQRTAPALLQPAHLQIRTGRVLFCPFALCDLQTLIIVQLLITRHCILFLTAPMTKSTTPKHSYGICYDVSRCPMTSVCALAHYCCTFCKNVCMALIDSTDGVKNRPLLTDSAVFRQTSNWWKWMTSSSEESFEHTTMRFNKLWGRSCLCNAAFSDIFHVSWLFNLICGFFVCPMLRSLC